MPRVVGKIRRSGPVELRDMEFLRRNTDRAAKITLPGPFTMSQQAKNEFYKDDEELAMAFADGGQCRSAGTAEGRRRRDPARRALGAQRSRRRQALRRQGDQSRTGRHHGADRGSSLLRLCRRGARRHQAVRLFVPRRIGGFHRRADFDRGRPAASSISACWPISRHKKIMLGVIDLGNPEIETSAVDRRPDPARPQIRRADRLIPAPGLRHEIHAAPHRVRKAEGDERRGRDRAEGDRLTRFPFCSKPLPLLWLHDSRRAKTRSSP